MTYTMLPVRLREALVGGLLLSGVHIYFSMNHSTAVNWPEVCVVYLSQLYEYRHYFKIKNGFWIISDCD